MIDLKSKTVFEIGKICSALERFIEEPENEQVQRVAAFEAGDFFTDSNKVEEKRQAFLNNSFAVESLLVDVINEFGNRI